MPFSFKLIDYQANIKPSIVLMSILGAMMLWNDHNFYSWYLGDYYCYTVILSLSCVLLITISLTPDYLDVIRVTKSDIIISLFTLFALIHTGLRGNQECLQKILIWYLVYLLARNGLKEKRYYIFYCGCCLIEAVVGITQYIQNKDVIGSFGTPSVYACFVSIGLIMSLLLLKDGQHSIGKRVLLVSVIVVCLFSVIISESRTAILAIVGSLCFLFRRKIRYRPLISLSILSLAISLYSINTGSVKGRLLIWKISFQLLEQYPLAGIGIGNFAPLYADQQAKYFSQNDSEDEKMTADLVMHPYNEYLGIVLALGIPAALGLLMISIYALSQVRRQELTGIITLLICIAIFCLSSLPLSGLSICLTTAILFALLATNQPVLFTIRIRKYIAVLLIPVMAYGVFHDSRHIFNVLQFKTLVEENGPNGVPNYKQLESCMQIIPDNGYMLYEMGRLLYAQGEYKNCIDIMLCAAKTIVNDDIYLYIGSSYEKLNSQNKAAFYYSYCSHMLPHRFMPLYRLFCLYKNNNDTCHARAMAIAISKMRVKVPSRTVTDIQLQIESFIHKSSYP